MAPPRQRPAPNLDDSRSEASNGPRERQSTTGQKGRKPANTSAAATTAAAAAAASSAGASSKDSKATASSSHQANSSNLTDPERQLEQSGVSCLFIFYFFVVALKLLYPSLV